MGQKARRKRKQSSKSFSATAPAPIVNIAERRSIRQPLQGGRKQGIFLATLTADGRVNFSMAMSFARAMASTAVMECPWKFSVHVEVAKKPADYARNCIVKRFMEESDDDWLVMIDSDQVVPDDFWKLCTVTDADIIGGLTPVWVGNMDPETAFRVNNYGVDNQGRCYNLPIPADSVDQPYRVPIVGTGCIAIRRRVFAPKPHGLGLSPFYFTYTEERKVQAGEDINFGVDANKAGFVVCVHPGVRFDHMKEIPLWQIERYYNARKKMEQEKRVPTDEQRLSIG